MYQKVLLEHFPMMNSHFIRSTILGSISAPSQGNCHRQSLKVKWMKVYNKLLCSQAKETYFAKCIPLSISASARISKGQGYQVFLRKRSGSSFGQKRAICVVQGKT
jgi:hypothetical protein